MISRRNFLGAAAAAASFARLAAAAPNAGNGIQKAVLITMLPKDLPYLDRFKLAVECGYKNMEVQTVDDDATARQIKDAADKAGLHIHSVMNMQHWGKPFSSSDPDVIAVGANGMELSLKQAHLYGADTVLLVPGVVSDDVTYQECWTRSQPHIRKLIPLAEKLDVNIAIENVGNKFLLTVKDFNQYIDEFNHPKVRAYFDVGNCLSTGVPQHWIRQIGKRIVKIHLKDRYEPMKLKPGGVMFGEGDINWAEVRQALEDVGFKGVGTLEVGGGDQPYLTELAQRVDRLISGIS